VVCVVMTSITLLPWPMAVMSAWIPEAPQQPADRVQGRQVVKPASLGVYNPITNQWVVPPADPRYMNREQKLY